MRTLRFAKVAAEAERLRLTYMARRYALRAVMAFVAFVFLTAMLAMLHIAAWLALVTLVAPVWSALALAGADLVLALALGLLALRDAPGAAEREARALRNTAAAQLMQPGPLIGVVAERALKLLLARFFTRPRA